MDSYYVEMLLPLLQSLKTSLEDSLNVLERVVSTKCLCHRSTLSIDGYKYMIICELFPILEGVVLVLEIQLHCQTETLSMMFGVVILLVP